MAGTVTSLTFQKRNPDRVSVYLDGKFAFGLSAMDAARLSRGQFLSDDEIAELMHLGLRAKAYDRAVRFLAVRPRSTLEVRQNLQRYRPRRRKRRERSTADGETPTSDAQEKLPPDLIDWVVQKLTDQGYLDDEAFARYWIEQRNRFKPMAPRAIRYELRGKGVDPGIIDPLLNEEVDPESAALAAARTRSHRWRHLEYKEFRHKMAGFLQRRGFYWSAAEQAIETAWQEIENDIHE